MKRIIIIGATSGIGKELALLYLKKGHKVGITGRRANLLQEVKNQHPANVITSCFDVTGSENQKHLQGLINELGGLDLLIYNSGFGDPSEEFNMENEIRTTKTNVNGCVDIAGYAFNYFVKQGYGQLAFTSSIAGLRGNSWAPAYSASKAFMSNFAESLYLKAKRLKKKIFVTDIKPGFVNTHMAKGNKRFWVATAQKAARQIFEAIEKKKRIAYITKRWWLVAKLIRILPFWLYRRIV